MVYYPRPKFISKALQFPPLVKVENTIEKMREALDKLNLQRRGTGGGGESEGESEGDRDLLTRSAAIEDEKISGPYKVCSQLELNGN